MESLLGWATANALAAAVLAVLAWAVSAVWRKPALAHALWLLVLIKLAAPPLWDAPISADWLTSGFIVDGDDVLKTIDDADADDLDKPTAMTESKPAPAAPQGQGPQRLVYEAEAEAEDAELSVENVLALDGRVSLIATDGEGEFADLESVGDTEPARPASALAGAGMMNPAWKWLKPRIAEHWTKALSALWLGGSLFWLIRAVIRIVRFERTLRLGFWLDERVQARADELARRMGLRRSPQVWMVPGAVSPMLWWTGWGTRLILPSALWERLDSDRQDALLVHELAHRRRGDHWARGIELLAAGLHWWNPVAWWARSRLRSAEEQCCDAWVVWTLPKSEKTYAHALLDALDFLAEGEASARTLGQGRGVLGFRLAALRSRPSLPAAATGIGQFSDLSQRITLIMRGNTSKAMTRASWAFVLTLCGLLPFTPTIAQDAKPKTVDVEVDVDVDAIAVDPNVGPIDLDFNVDVADLDLSAINPAMQPFVFKGFEAIEGFALPEHVAFAFVDGDDDDGDREKKREKKDGVKDKEKDNDKAKEHSKLSDEDKKKLETEIAKARAEMEKAQKELQAAARRLAELHQKAGKPGSARIESRVITLAGPDGKVRTLGPGAIRVEGGKAIDLGGLGGLVTGVKPQIKVMIDGKEIDVQNGVAKIEGKDGEKKEIRVEVRAEGSAAAGGLGDTVRARVLRRLTDEKGAKDIIIAAPPHAGTPVPPIPPAARGMFRVQPLPPGAPPAPAIGPDADRRLRELETKLNRVLEQLEKMQGEHKHERNPGR